jgi:hypothetical protein
MALVEFVLICLACGFAMVFGVALGVVAVLVLGLLVLSVLRDVGAKVLDKHMPANVVAQRPPSPFQRRES